MDWARYEVDPSKIRNYLGNIIDLGEKVSLEKLQEALNPNLQNPDKFVYPAGRQWEIENICIPLDEMRNPKTFDRNISPALSVLKRGRTTGVTCGVAKEVDSYVRTYFSITAPSFPGNDPSLPSTSPSLHSRLEEIPALS